MFLSSRQSLRTTWQSKRSPELISIDSVTPGFGMESTSICLLNRTSLLLMVSSASVSSRLMRSDGILRLISTVCGIRCPGQESDFEDGTGLPSSSNAAAQVTMLGWFVSTVVPTSSTLQDVLARYWGFATFRPLQQQAMEA